MKFGVVGRADPRGLGIQTSEVARNLCPDAVLLVEPRPAGWPQRREWYADQRLTDAPWRQGILPERIVRPWLEELSGGVVYSAETFYDPRFPAWCAAAGVTPVRHANPEQLARDEVVDGDGTVWWAATDWRLEKLPAGTRVVPMPVALDRFRGHNADQDIRDKSAGHENALASACPVRFLHSIGHQAQEDRAGSRVVSRAIQKVGHPCELIVRCQDRRPEVAFRLGERVVVQTHRGGVDNYWDAYNGCDVLVLPRRYGGLSLPSQEAMAAGLALIMTNCSPNERWPGLKVAVAGRREVHMRCGPVEVCDPDPQHLADLMTGLAEDRAEVARLRAEARLWAEANSWEALTPLWRAELVAAAASVATVSRQGMVDSVRTDQLEASVMPL